MPKIWWEKTSPKGKYHAYAHRYPEDVVAGRSYCGTARSKVWQAGSEDPPGDKRCETCVKNIRESKRLFDRIIRMTERSIAGRV